MSTSQTRHKINKMKHANDHQCIFSDDSCNHSMFCGFNPKNKSSWGNIKSFIIPRSL